MGLSVQVHYRRVLFAALLKAHGQLGPAEIPGKRDWTYRQVRWLAAPRRAAGPAGGPPLQPAGPAAPGAGTAMDDAPERPAAT